MATQLLWQSSVTTSALHAAEGLGRGITLAEARLTTPFSGPATRLWGEIAGFGLPAGKFWEHLLGLSPSNAGVRQIIETALIKSLGKGDTFAVRVDRLAPVVNELLAAFRAALPNLSDELPLRERPLREQWEARGPGLLASLARLTDERLLPPQATVVLVHPAFGGGGEAHLPYNSARLEAVLANPHADLPEIVRLAWLIGQLQLDLPPLSETILAPRLPHVARWAMLPATLAAAEQVELVRWSPELLRRAIEAWRLSAPADVDAARLVLDWWETYQLSRPPFAVALAALDQMFG